MALRGIQEYIARDAYNIAGVEDERQRKRGKNNNESFNKLHMILLIHVYVFTQIRQVKLKRPVEKYECQDPDSRHASRHQRDLQCDFQC